MRSTMLKVRKGITVPHLGFGAFRAVYALTDPRRRKHLRLLFQRPVLGVVKGHAWLPRSW